MDEEWTDKRDSQNSDVDYIAGYLSSTYLAKISFWYLLKPHSLVIHSFIRSSIDINFHASFTLIYLLKFPAEIAFIETSSLCIIFISQWS